MTENLHHRRGFLKAAGAGTGAAGVAGGLAAGGLAAAPAGAAVQPVSSLRSSGVDVTTASGIKNDGSPTGWAMALTYLSV